MRSWRGQGREGREGVWLLRYIGLSKERGYISYPLHLYTWQYPIIELNSSIGLYTWQYPIIELNSSIGLYTWQYPMIELNSSMVKATQIPRKSYSFDSFGAIQ